MDEVLYGTSDSAPDSPVRITMHEHDQCCIRGCSTISQLMKVSVWNEALLSYLTVR